ncbi:uncharacterized protein F4817DRAFT_349492 [Daldinia loculata]|uniref:uncharacterized protein n=1 Tax=Daldinia loculata TaxID=103429 RepID=UPI0020C27B41|nr:uncharacterized protein F4817DRAFT_349492 [Daldinia loculata]KAI1643496.1 hypothetical protein F4817DRAFT_349492 [Daldinia loculata]
MLDPSSLLLWTLLLLVTALCLALCLALLVAAHILTSYATAYLAAPHEITTFLEAVDSSIQENEGFNGDVEKVPRLADKLRLGRLLREIQKSGDDLREELNRLVLAEGGRTLRTSARFLWAGHRKQLEERVRRLDMLRMRFLVVYMGIVATMAGDRAKQAERTTPKDPEKAALHFQHQMPTRPCLPKGLNESIKQKPPLRRLTTQATTSMTGHHEKNETPHQASHQTPHRTPQKPPHQMNWMGVVQELQRSPRMQKRHASIELAMRSPPPISPLGSPISSTPEMDNGRFRDAIDSIPEDKDKDKDELKTRDKRTRLELKTERLRRPPDEYSTNM